MRCAIFSCMGLGDGLIVQVLARNLVQAGHSVCLFHPFLHHLSGWFPGVEIATFPPDLAAFDHFFLFYEKSQPMLAVLKELEKTQPEKLTVLNPIATPHTDYPYWENGKFNGRLPFALNLQAFSSQFLGKETTIDIGLKRPEDVIPKKYPKRVVIHPVSSRKGKNWSKAKFLRLSEELKKRGFEPAFILTEKEKGDFPEVEGKGFSSLDEMARFIAESGYMIGNDSGIGHLASALGLPTVTICRHKMAADFWRPAWSKGEVIVPPSWIPNLKGMRWRDKKWQHFVPVKKVMGAFLQLVENTS